ncbi:MAG: ferrous iron transport protein B [bacterium]|nr:ferrous iron transport protein B [bacterium]
MSEPPNINKRKLSFRNTPSDARAIRIALAGNPNSGKTTLFNTLTGMHQKVGNYPGVTVEKKEGHFTHRGQQFTVVDLPGTYSLSATSDDERLVRDVLLGVHPNEPLDMVLLVVDASHLERHLYLATQVLDLGQPVVVALTMNDEARYLGRAVDPEVLSRELGVPVVQVIAPKNQGLVELREAVAGAVGAVPTALPWRVGDQFLLSIDELALQIGQHHPAPLSFRRYVALQLLIEPLRDHPLLYLPGLSELVAQHRSRLDASGIRWREAEARGRYAWIREAAKDARALPVGYSPTLSDRVDRVLMHPVAGMLIFLGVMALMFQSIFTWAAPFMDAIDNAFAWLGTSVSSLLPAGPLSGLLVDGVIAGVGSVVIFLPQILLLFLFIALLEDSGYMARAAFLMNRHMRRFGLNGRAFIPMLSGFACAIPAIMATRTISDPKDRLITMMVVPLTSCSARLPVYSLMIAAAVPPVAIAGGFTVQGATLWGAYIFSLLAAVVMALVFRRTILKGEPQAFILELPPYRLPSIRTVLVTMWQRGKLFLTQAGTIILAISIVLWFLAKFPAQPKVAAQFEAQHAQAATALSGEALDARVSELDEAEQGAMLRGSFAGQLGQLIEPTISPLGFDWKIGIGLIASFAAREVFVSTMAIVYNVGNADETSPKLIDALRGQVNESTGKPLLTTLVAVNLMLFFILACQCMSTVAVVKRETNSWKWPLFMVGYMTVLAWVVCFVVYQVGTKVFGLV